MQSDDFFIWTEAYNCAEILPPFLESFRKHHNFPIYIATSREEFDELPKIAGVSLLPVKNSLLSLINYTNSRAIRRGFKSGHLGTARIWSYIIQNRREKFLIHLDADTVFLGEVVTRLLEGLRSDYDFVGTRRPYLHRGYRTTGRDARLLDRRPDALNTDIIGFRRDAVPGRYSPLLTRWIRGKRPLRYPVVDYFDPVLFRAIDRNKKVLYLDSPERGTQSTPNHKADVHLNRISFAAVGSGVNFHKHPEIETSPGYRSYAISSFALYSKYLLNRDIGENTLDNPEIENKLKKLNKKTWKLS